jgi:hypothetical protein
MDDEINHLAAIGFGYTARALAKRLLPTGWIVTGTSQSHKGAEKISALGVNALVWNPITPDYDIIEALGDVTHILISAPPNPIGDPIFNRLVKMRDYLPELYSISYLSTVGVYGNHEGGWVDEDTPTNPASERGLRRVAAENAWLAHSEKLEVAVQVFRLPGIYGPGRSPFDRLEAGTARRIVKPGQVFNRMHVDDIAGAIEAAINCETYYDPVINLTDDLPAPPQDVIAYAAELMGVEPPPEVSFDDADMTAMARSFYGENKRVSNKRMKEQLGYKPQYPTYREGLQAIWDDRETSDDAPA